MIFISMSMHGKKDIVEKLDHEYKETLAELKLLKE